MPAACTLAPSPATYTVLTGSIPKVIDAAQTVQLRSVGTVDALHVLSAYHTNDTDFQIGYCDLGDFDPPTIVINTTSTTIDKTVAIGDGRLIFIKCLTAALGTYTTTLTVASNDPTGPTSVVITYTSSAAAILIEVSPLAHNYGQVLVGDTTSEFLFRVTSIGANPAQVDAPTIPADFIAGSTVPSYPVTIPFTGGLDFIGGGAIDFIAGGAIDLITPIDYFDFGICAKPLSFFNIVEEMEVNSDADNDPVEVQLIVYGLPITPYGALTMGDVEHFLVATDSENDPPNPIGPPMVLEGDPDNLDSERDAFLYKQLNFQLPGIPKSTYAFDLHYEDLGNVDLGLTLSTVNADLSQTAISAGSVGADELTKLATSLPVEVQGEIAYMIFERDADDGPLSLTDYIFRHEPFTVRRGEAPIPTDITPYAQLTDPETLSFMVFVSGMDDTQLAADNERNVTCGLDAIECTPVCALPRRISALLPGTVDMWPRNLYPGPFALVGEPNIECEFGVRLCGVFRRTDSPQALKKMEAWVSDDQGFAWAVQDANGFTPTTGTIASAHCCQDDKVVHVFTQDDTGRVEHSVFDLDSKTWTLNKESVNGNGSDASTAITFIVAGCVTSSGDLAVAYAANKENVGGDDRHRIQVRFRVDGVWSSGTAVGRTGQAFSSILQDVVPLPNQIVRVHFQKTPGGVASATDDENQEITQVSHALSPIVTWLTHGIAGQAWYGHPVSYNDLANYLLPIRNGTNAEYYVFSSASQDDISNVDMSTDVQEGALGSQKASFIIGRPVSMVHTITADWSLGSSTMWARLDPDSTNVECSPSWVSANNLQELAGSIIRLYDADWLMFFLGNATGADTLFFLEPAADLNNIGDITVGDWIAALPEQDADISYTSEGCNVMLIGQDDQKSEVLPFWEKTFDFTEPSTGSGRTHEQSLYRIYVYYEALGTGLWTMTATTRRGQVVTQNRTISSLSDGSTQIAVFDMKTTDVLQKVRFTVQCGVANIVLISLDSEYKGQYIPPVQT